jgi:hypothetical protein
MHLVVTCLLAIALAGCSSDADGYELAAPNLSTFQAETYPVLVRDCAFPTCHGSAQREFRIWGPGRVRLDPNAPLFENETDPFTGKLKPQQPNSAEIAFTVSSATGFIDAKNPERSLLLRKPLSTEAGGSGHLGVDRFGRNVYRSVDSEGYVALSRWVFTLTKIP